jgi:hypothetical protein
MKITKRQLRRIIKEERAKLLSEQFDFAAADREMVQCAEQMGALLAGRPDVAMKIRDALADGPFKQGAEALFKAYESAQAAADSDYMSFGAGYDDDDF